MTAADGKPTWLIFTFAVALIPVFIRFITVSEPLWNMEVFNALDFLVFGVVVFASSTNRAGCFGDNSTTWKMLMNVASLMFMIVFGVLFISYLLWQSHPDTIDYTVLRIGSAVLAGWAVLMGIAVHKKLSRAKGLR